MRRTTLKAALLISLLSTAAPAFLTPTNALAQDEEALVAARAKFQRAIELEHGKNWGGALKLFRQVAQVKMTAQVRYHIASCEENLGQLVVALAGYELALDLAEGLHPDFIADVEESIEDLKARIPKLVLERGEGAEAAAIELDGVALGNSSIGIETPLDPGPHTVTATAPGFEAYRRMVTVEEGSIEVLSINLKSTSKPSPPPVVPADLVETKKYGIAPYIVGGAGLGTAVLGGVFLVVASSKQSQATENCDGQDCSGLTPDEERDSKSLHSSAKTFSTVGVVSLGLGVAGIATGAVLYYLDRGKEDPKASARLSWSPSAPSSDWGLSLVGSF